MGKIFLETVRSERLAHLSYVVGRGGKAAVIDPPAGTNVDIWTSPTAIPHTAPVQCAGPAWPIGSLPHWATNEGTTLSCGTQTRDCMHGKSADAPTIRYLPFTPRNWSGESNPKKALLFWISAKSTNMKRDDCPVRSISFWGNFRKGLTRFLRIGLSQLFAAAASGPSSSHRF